MSVPLGDRAINEGRGAVSARTPPPLHQDPAPMGTAAAANVAFYAERAAAYDSEAACCELESERERLKSLLVRAVALAPQQDPVLDACGGSGNASAVLHELGRDSVLADVSPDMTELWRRKSAKLGFTPEIHVAEIGQFLRSDPRVWGLVVFSSALHHLDDYVSILSLASQRLAPGGILATIYDPTSAGFLVRKLRKIDWIGYEMIHHPRAFAARLIRKMRRRVGRGEAPPNPGRQAERHAITGIDDFSLAALLESNGMVVVAHEREYRARLAPIRALLRLFGQPASFSLLARAECNPGVATSARSTNALGSGQDMPHSPPSVLG